MLLDILDPMLKIVKRIIAVTDSGALSGCYSEGYDAWAGRELGRRLGPSSCVRPFYFQSGTNMGLPTLNRIYGMAHRINDSNNLACVDSETRQLVLI